MDSKTIELLQKLFALINDPAATEGEVINATAKMQQILFKHNLSIEEAINQVVDEEGDLWKVFIWAYGKKSYAPTRAEREWACRLAAAIARYNFCQTLVRRREFRDIVFVGQPHNIAAVREIWKYAIKQIITIAPAEFTNFRKAGGYAERKTFERNFSFGALQRIEERLRQQWEGLQSTVPGLEIIRYNEEAIQLWMFGHQSGTVSSKTPSSDSEGYAQGYEAGASVDLAPSERKLA